MGWITLHFHKQVAFGFKLEKLKTQVTDQDYKNTSLDDFLDRVVLSRIAVTERTS